VLQIPERGCNAVAESFNSALEFELLAEWIEEYNTVRRHSTDGMLSPVDHQHAQALARA
jgi:putative transposase